jgi:sugar lactone lactonase YvrE
MAENEENEDAGDEEATVYRLDEEKVEEELEETYAIPNAIAFHLIYRAWFSMTLQSSDTLKRALTPLHCLQLKFSDASI